ncbi:acyl carrier protein [Roseobacter sp.]|uniref:acyl carrier protein n=1 Tax=Roseobacter sp. TaxID=1907202 RepID=UPI003858E245
MTCDDIYELLSDELGIETDDIEPATLLFSEGIVDSFALVTMMMFVEERAGIRISPTDVNLDNFDSINRILAFAQRESA